MAATEHGHVDVLEAYRLRTVHHLSYTDIAAVQGVARQTVTTALKRFVASLEPSAQVQSFETAKAQLLGIVQQRLLATCGDADKIAKMSVRDAAVAFGILFDKQRLANNQSTSNVSMLSKLITQADAELFPVERKQKAQADAHDQAEKIDKQA